MTDFLHDLRFEPEGIILVKSEKEKITDLTYMWKEINEERKGERTKQMNS